MESLLILMGLKERIRFHIPDFVKIGEDWRWQTHLANIPVLILFEFKDKGITDTDNTQ